MEITKADTARKIAQAIKKGIDSKVDGRITHSTFAVSLQLHVALEAIAKELEVDVTWFKIECGVGQPRAYFI